MEIAYYFFVDKININFMCQVVKNITNVPIVIIIVYCVISKCSNCCKKIIICFAPPPSPHTEMARMFGGILSTLFASHRVRRLQIRGERKKIKAN